MLALVPVLDGLDQNHQWEALAVTVEKTEEERGCGAGGIAVQRQHQRHHQALLDFQPRPSRDRWDNHLMGVAEDMDGDTLERGKAEA